MYNHNSTREEIAALAKALESSIFQCMINAHENPTRAKHWENHAALLEQKFTTEFKKHYSYFIYPNM